MSTGASSGNNRSLNNWQRWRATHLVCETPLDATPTCNAAFAASAALTEQPESLRQTTKSHAVIGASKGVRPVHCDSMATATTTFSYSQRGTVVSRHHSTFMEHAPSAVTYSTHSACLLHTMTSRGQYNR